MDWGRTLALGSLQLPISLIALVPGLLLGGFFLRRHFDDKELFRRVRDVLYQGLFWCLVIWKISPLFNGGFGILANPLSLIYIPGNSLGLALGGLWFAGRLGVFLFRQKGNRWTIIKGYLWWAGSGLGTFLVLWGALSMFPLTNVKADQPMNPKATELVLETLDGRKFNLESLKGKTVILNFWATWCPPCEAEIPELENFYLATDRTKVEVLGVNLTQSEKSYLAIQEFRDRKRMDFPIVLDRDGKLQAAFGVVSVPTTWVLSPEGRWKEHRTGAINREVLVNFLKP